MKQLSESKDLLLIFTKNPEAGKVKTRLAADVGDETALEIYRFLLQHTFDVTKDLKLDKEVHYSESIPEKDIWNKANYTKRLQRGNDLGERMQQAFEQAFSNNYEKVVIIGSDLYDLSQKDLEKAFQALDEHEFVIGPAQDGGYYLLGMRRQMPQLFRNKNWSTPTVLQDTLKDLKGENLKLLETRNDIDHYSDIRTRREFQQFLKQFSL